MALKLTPSQIALLSVILGVFAAMLTTLMVLGARALRGEALVDRPARARGPVPWGWVSVLLIVLLAWPVLPVVVPGTYEVVKRVGHVRIGPPPRRATAEAQAEKKPGVRPTGPVGIVPPTKDVPPYTFMEQMFLGSVINVILLVLVPLLLWSTSGARPRDLGLTRGQILDRVRLGVVTFLAITPCVMLINLTAVLVWTLVSRPRRHPLEEMLREGLTPSGVVLAYVSAVVLAPLAEEMVFRGVFQGWLYGLEKPEPVTESADDLSTLPGDLALPPAARAEPSAQVNRPKVNATLRFWRPIGLTSFLFAVVHAPQMPAPFAIFFLSLGLGWLMESTGSLVPSVVLHACFNAFNTTLMVFAVSMPMPEKDVIEKGAPPPAGASNRGEKCTFRLALAGEADKFGGG